MRAFVAVAVAEPALSEGRALLAALRDAVDGVRWTRPEGLHVTLHFFGEVEPERAQAAMDALEPVARAAAPFTLRLAGLGSFPQTRPERVLWLGSADGAGELAGLAAATTAGLAAAGFAVDARPFHAHCTLGRPRGRGLSPEARSAWRAARADLSPFTADRLTLFESRPGPGGARYEALREIPLGPAA